MELTQLDTDLIRLHQTLGELVAMGLAKEMPGQDASKTRYRITAPAGPPEDEEEEESEASARAHAVGA